MNKITLGLLLVLVSANAFAKKVTAASLVPPRTWQLTCPPNPEVSITCSTSAPVNCYLASGSLVTGGWGSTPLASSGMPAGFSMPSPQSVSPKAVFQLVSGTATQGSAFLAHCSYEYSFNGTVRFDAVQAYTPPSGTATCQFVLAKRAITCQ